MITSPIKMLAKFGHIITSTIQFDSRDKTLLVTPWIEMMKS